MYSTPQEVRDLLGLEIDDAEDDILEEFIQKAQKVILHYVQVKIQDEEITLDTSGTTFTLSHPYIADIDFNKSITKDDLTVYGWVDSDDIETRTTLNISQLWSEHGIVKLSADASDYEKVTVDYSYYTCKIDWDLMNLATAYYAGMLWAAREEFLVPEDLVIGNIRMRDRRSRSWERIREEFLRIIFHITSLPMDITSYRKITRSPRSAETYYGPGTTYEIEDESTGENVKDIL